MSKDNHSENDSTPTTTIPNLDWMLETHELIKKYSSKVLAGLTVDEFEDMLETFRETRELRPEQVAKIRRLAGVE